MRPVNAECRGSDGENCPDEAQQSRAYGGGSIWAEFLWTSTIWLAFRSKHYYKWKHGDTKLLIVFKTWEACRETTEWSRWGNVRQIKLARLRTAMMLYEGTVTLFYRQRASHWRILKERLYDLTWFLGEKFWGHSFIHSLIHPSIHSFIHSLIHPFIHSFSWSMFD